MATGSDAAENTAVGALSGDAISSGQKNTIVGSEAAANRLTSGDKNTAIGAETLGKGGGANLTGNDNTCLGFQSGLALQGAGNQNTAVGSQSGASITTGQNNVLIGYQAGTSSSPVTVATENNQLCLGNDSIANSFIKVDWTTGSDIRDKTDIETLPDAAGLNFVCLLYTSDAADE